MLGEPLNQQLPLKKSDVSNSLKYALESKIEYAQSSACFADSFSNNRDWSTNCMSRLFAESKRFVIPVWAFFEPKMDMYSLLAYHKGKIVLFACSHASPECTETGRENRVLLRELKTQPGSKLL